VYLLGPVDIVDFCRRPEIFPSVRVNEITIDHDQETVFDVQSPEDVKSAAPHVKVKVKSEATKVLEYDEDTADEVAACRKRRTGRMKRTSRALIFRVQSMTRTRRRTTTTRRRRRRRTWLLQKRPSVSKKSSSVSSTRNRNASASAVLEPTQYQRRMKEARRL
jgi:hypothetical protein